MKAIQAVPGSDAYLARIDAIQGCLRDYRDNPRVVRSAEELEKLEREMRDLTEELAALIAGRQIQHALDSEQLQEAQNKLAEEWPHRLKNHERARVWVRTVSGHEIGVEASCFRRKGKRPGKRRYRGFHLRSRVEIRRAQH